MSRGHGTGGLVEWRRVELGKAADIRGGATPRRNNPAYWGGNIPWLTPTDLPANGSGVTEVTSTESYISEEGLASCSASVLPPGTVLFSSRASIGKVGIAAVPLSTNQGFANLIPRRGVDSRYLAWCLHFHAPRIEGLAGSTTFKEVSKSALRRFPIPLPPPSEQRRIVEILDQADRLRRLRAEADAKADRILPALFIKMFGDPATNPMGWPVEAISSFAYVKGGKRLPKRESYAPTRTSFPYIRGVDISANIIDTGDIRFLTPEVQKRIARYTVSTDDVVMTIAGKIGVVAPVPDELDGANLTENAAKIVPREPDLFDSTYLSAALNMPGVQQQILALAGHVTIGKLALFRIEKIRVPLPPMPIQRRFAALVREAQLLLEGMRRDNCRIEDLFLQLLDRAFTGALTASWREAHMKELLQEMEQQAKAIRHVEVNT